MAIIGKVESLWRYPVKSMRGEELSQAFVGFAGIYGDRLFAFRSSERPSGFPYLTGREQMKMVITVPVSAIQTGPRSHRTWPRRRASSLG